MDTRLTEEAQSIQAVARRLADTLRETLRVTEKAGVDSVIETHQALGFEAMDWPESAGGHELGLATKVLALEAMAFGDGAAALALERTAWVWSPLLRCAALAQRSCEPGPDTAMVIDTEGQLTQPDGNLSGFIPYVPADSIETLFVLSGSVLHRLSTGFEITSASPGALNALGASHITLNDAQPDWSEALSDTDAAEIRGIHRLYLAAILVGMAEAASQEARTFCMDRVTFGKKVAHHQAVAFILADMEIEIRAARLLVQTAAMRIDADQGADHAHDAFIQAAECALFVTNYGVQLHGAHGYVEDYPVEKWMRDARAITLLAGGVDGARTDINTGLDARLSRGTT